MSCFVLKLHPRADFSRGQLRRPCSKGSPTHRLPGRTGLTTGCRPRLRAPRNPPVDQLCFYSAVPQGELHFNKHHDSWKQTSSKGFANRTQSRHHRETVRALFVQMGDGGQAGVRLLPPLHGASIRGSDPSSGAPLAHTPPGSTDFSARAGRKSSSSSNPAPRPGHTGNENKTQEP